MVSLACSHAVGSLKRGEGTCVVEAVGVDYVALVGRESIGGAARRVVESRAVAILFRHHVVITPTIRQSKGCGSIHSRSERCHIDAGRTRLISERAISTANIQVGSHRREDNRRANVLAICPECELLVAIVDGVTRALLHQVDACLTSNIAGAFHSPQRLVGISIQAFQRKHNGICRTASRAAHGLRRNEHFRGTRLAAVDGEAFGIVSREAPEHSIGKVHIHTVNVEGSIVALVNNGICVRRLPLAETHAIPHCVTRKRSVLDGCGLDHVDRAFNLLYRHNKVCGHDVSLIFRRRYRERGLHGLNAIDSNVGTFVRSLALDSLAALAGRNSQVGTRRCGRAALKTRKVEAVTRDGISVRHTECERADV